MKERQEVNSKATVLTSKMRLPPIAQDKANHAIYGALIFFVLQFVLSPVFALLGVAIVAATKEIYDFISKSGTPDVLDFLATIAGSLPLFFLLSC